jgi:hypothetical protein
MLAVEAVVLHVALRRLEGCRLLGVALHWTSDRDRFEDSESLLCLVLIDKLVRLYGAGRLLFAWCGATTAARLSEEEMMRLQRLLWRSLHCRGSCDNVVAL